MLSFFYNLSHWIALNELKLMANKTNLGIGVVIALLIAGYLGIDLNQNTIQSSQKNTEKSIVSANEEDIATAQSHSSVSDKNQQITPEHKNSDVSKTQYDDVLSSQNRHGLEVIRQSYDRKISNVQVQSAGRVKAILRDDNEGSRHQKFILSLDNGLTILVAHNIDLAPRVENLGKGDVVEFFGEYEYSQQGGVIHWTHHDPRGRHTDGWLKHQGKTYK